MAKFRKKPIVIEAFQLPLEVDYNLDSFFNWADEVGFLSFYSGKTGSLIIPTLEGDMEASPGDWIIKGVNGEFYPCKPGIFKKTYDEVLD